MVQVQGLLAQGKVGGFYVSRRARDPGMFRLPDHFWLLAEGTTALLCGEFHDMGQPSPLLFQRGVIEAALMAQPGAGSQAKGGRPRKVDAALAVYAAIYPAGHEAAGVTWKEAVARVSSETGERIAVGTLRDALKTTR
ncbi:hypothetical protein [Gemmobacter sp. 24YEA27]|uniref:hypothetical protein n=1 Tax=Gemmobacter sp. 24YEA27 TaxID=3040672 RepID=UPI0024B35EAF|nr:hypothetical protein [Gemmobacter sp. 24YEA27]